MSLSTLRNQIAVEYNWFHATIANHPYWSSAAFFALGIATHWLVARL